MTSNKRYWFLAEVIERAEDGDHAQFNPNRHYLTWVNTLLIRAKSFSEAYDKGMKIAKERYPTRYEAISGNIVQWTVLGLSSLRQIEEELTDGSEISWISMGYISVKRSDSLIKTKQQLVSD
jgi:hypothetical protein